MPELTQRMIDAGATFFDANGIPMRPDGTPALEENQGIMDVLPELNAQNAQWVRNVPWTEERGPPSPWDTTATQPVGYGFGPTYGDTPQDYPENRTPTTLANFGLPEDWDYREHSAEGPDPSWADLSGRDRSTGGGFFTADDLFGGEVPPSFQSGSNAPSTNNYRLLPLEYRHPNYVLRNGILIDLNHPWLQHPFGEILQSYAGGANARQPSAIGPAVFPAYNYTAQGWPGSVTDWNATPYRQG